MIRYKIYQNQQKKGLNAGKWFARAVSDETFDLAKLAEHMSKHNSPYSSGVIKGVLTDMVDCIKELLLDGKSVKIDDLAIFGVESEARLPKRWKSSRWRRTSQVCGSSTCHWKLINDQSEARQPIEAAGGVSETDNARRRRFRFRQHSRSET